MNPNLLYIMRPVTEVDNAQHNLAESTRWMASLWGHCRRHHTEWLLRMYNRVFRYTGNLQTNV